MNFDGIKNNFDGIKNNWKKEIQQQEQDFVKEFMVNNADWVRDRRIAFLKQEMKKIDKENLQWIELISKIQTPWLLEEAKKCIELKKYRKLAKEIKMYEQEKTFWKEDSELTADEIEEAHQADCSQFVNVIRREGKRAWALCPFHSEKNPSFCCYEGNGFYCFGCNIGGDAIDLVQKLYNLNFKEAVKYINKYG